MSKKAFQQMLVVFSQNFNHDLTEKRLNTFTALAQDTIGFEYDWKRVTKEICLKEKFFPCFAQIAELCRDQRVEEIMKEKPRDLRDQNEKSLWQRCN